MSKSLLDLYDREEPDPESESQRAVDTLLCSDLLIGFSPQANVLAHIENAAGAVAALQLDDITDPDCTQQNYLTDVLTRHLLKEIDRVVEEYKARIKRN